MTVSWRRPAARYLRRFARDTRGTATVEFVIMAPVFFLVFMSSVEAGVLMVRNVMLERAVDLTVRNLRLGTWPTPEPALVKQSICDATLVIHDCMTSVLLEMRPVSTTTWAPLDPNAACVNRATRIDPLVEFKPGAQNEMMIVRACAIVDPVFPLTGLGLQLQKDTSGGYALTATSAFVNEPDPTR